MIDWMWNNIELGRGAGVPLTKVMDTSSSNLQLTFTATLKGHSGWVTAIATPSDPSMNFIVSSSRGTYLI